MQMHAEDAVKEHVGEYLQPQFTKEREAEAMLHIQALLVMELMA